jgi:hypothetical protein
VPRTKTKDMEPVTPGVTDPPKMRERADQERALQDTRAHLTRQYAHAQGVWCCTAEDPLYQNTFRFIDWQPSEITLENRRSKEAAALDVEQLALASMSMLNGPKLSPSHHHQKSTQATVALQLQPEVIERILNAVLAQSWVDEAHEISALEGSGDSFTTRVQAARHLLNTEECLVRGSDWVSPSELKKQGKPAVREPMVKKEMPDPSAVRTRRQAKKAKPPAALPKPRITIDLEPFEASAKESGEESLLVNSFLNHVRIADMAQSQSAPFAFIGLARLKRLLAAGQKEDRLETLLNNLRRRAASYLGLPEDAGDEEIAVGFPTFWEAVQLEP